MLNSAEHEICPSNKSQITNNCKFFLAKHCMLSRVEHKKMFITSGPDLTVLTVHTEYTSNYKGCFFVVDFFVLFYFVLFLSYFFFFFRV